MRWTLPVCLTAAAAFWMMATAAQGQALQLTATVDSQTVPEGGVVNLTLMLSSNQLEIKQLGSLFPNVQAIEGFTLLERGMQSQNSSYSVGFNGQPSVQASVSQEFALRPNGKGTLTIPPFQTRYKGALIQSKPITIRVSGAGKEASGMPEELKQEGVPLPYSQHQGLNEFLQKAPILLRASSDKKTYYAGEAVWVQYELCLTNQMKKLVENSSNRLASESVDLGVKQMPDRSDFQTLAEDGPHADQWVRKSFGGIEYQVADLYSALLLPMKLGKLRISPFVLNGAYSVARQGRGGDMFSFGFDPFGRQQVGFAIPSVALEIEIRPLPQDGRPENFSGAVGDFTIRAELDRDSVGLDEYAALRLIVAGKGTLSTVQEPDLPAMPQFKQHGNLSREEVPRKNDPLRGEVVFEAVLRPNEAGKLDIPPVAFTYFDPAKEQYRSTQSEPLTLNVTPKEGGIQNPLVISLNNAPDADYSKGRQTVQLNANEMMFIQEEGFQGLRARAPLASGTVYWLLQLLPAGLVFGAVYLRRQRERLRGDAGLARRRGARGAAGKRLKAARIQLQRQNAAEFYAELIRGVRGFVADKTGLAADGPTNEELAERVRQSSKDDALADELRAFLDQCDQARYAPSAVSASMDEMLQRGSDLIQRLSRTLK
ncbi:protein BatD [Candidatus Sumerlaeota bacterium]|nr:protein BatD [Candidatus Sumerlaeota bacterium]